MRRHRKASHSDDDAGTKMRLLVPVSIPAQTQSNSKGTGMRPLHVSAPASASAPPPLAFARDQGHASTADSLDSLLSLGAWLLHAATWPWRFGFSCAVSAANAVLRAVTFPLRALQAYLRQTRLENEADELLAQLEGAEALNAALKREVQLLLSRQRQEHQKLSQLRDQRRGLMEVTLAGMQQVNELRARVEILEAELACRGGTTSARMSLRQMPEPMKTTEETVSRKKALNGRHAPATAATTHEDKGLGREDNSTPEGVRIVSEDRSPPAPADGVCLSCSTGVPSRTLPGAAIGDALGSSTADGGGGGGSGAAAAAVRRLELQQHRGLLWFGFQVSVLLVLLATLPLLLFLFHETTKGGRSDLDLMPGTGVAPSLDVARTILAVVVCASLVNATRFATLLHANTIRQERLGGSTPDFAPRPQRHALGRILGVVLWAPRMLLRGDAEGGLLLLVVCAVLLGAVLPQCLLTLCPSLGDQSHMSSSVHSKSAQMCRGRMPSSA